MPEREQGLRRVAVVTTGLVVVGVAGSLAVATIARADSQAATTGTSTSNSTGSFRSTPPPPRYGRPASATATSTRPWAGRCSGWATTGTCRCCR
jgi:hypothetical protein